MTSGMTLSSMSPVRNPQHPPSTPLLDLPLLGTLLIEISTQNFQGMLQSNVCPLPLPRSHNTPSPPALTPTQIYLKTNFRVAHSTLPQGNYIYYPARKQLVCMTFSSLRPFLDIPVLPLATSTPQRDHLDFIHMCIKCIP